MNVAGEEMLFDQPSRVAPYEKMKQLILDSARKGYNRSFDEAHMPMLDKYGVNILKPLMLHRHINGLPAPVHVRCFAFLKLEGQDAPEQVQFDVDKELFEQCVTTDEWKEMME